MNKINPKIKNIIIDVSKKYQEYSNTEFFDFLQEICLANELGIAEEAISDEQNRMLKTYETYKGCSNDVCYVEIRIGVGGMESSIFVNDLFKMYVKYLKDFKISGTETFSSDVGFRKVVFKATGKDVLRRMMYEAGVHRIQRVPQTEASGRIHTSTSTVAVLPEVNFDKITIPKSDVRVDKFRASGSGGQHVNKTESAIRLTHIKTMISVQCQDEKVQQNNLKKAWQELERRVNQKILDEKTAEIINMRNKDIGTASRCEKIRTYNFPQNRVTDHRVEMSFFDINKFMNSEYLQDLCKALVFNDFVERLIQLAQYKKHV